MARIIRSLFRNGSESAKGGGEFRDMRYNDLYDFDEDRPNTSGGDASNKILPHQQCRKVLESFGKGDFVVYDRVGGLSRPPSRANSQGDGSSEVVGGGISTKVRNRTPTPQPLVVWRPSSAGKSRPGTPSDLSRPMSPMRGAGYSSGVSKLDSSSLQMQQKEGANARAQLKELEQRVHKLLEESTEANLTGNQTIALEKAKEAGRHERLINRQREKADLLDQINNDLTYAVCFNLGYHYETHCLYSEALNVYSRIVKNKQFSNGGRLRVNMGNIYYRQKNYSSALKMYRMALDQTPTSCKETRHKIMRNIGICLLQNGHYQEAIQSFEAAMEIKYDQQTGYNLIICYSLLGNIQKMKNCFTKMLLVRSCYDLEFDSEKEEYENSLLKVDELQEDLKARKKQSNKYIFNAARIISPLICSTHVEGYDWAIGILNDQNYINLAHELEMEKSIYYLKRQDSVQAIALLKDFEKKEKELKACASTNLSFLYFLEGDVDNAQAYAELAVRTNPYNGSALVNQGNCLFAKGDLEGAELLYNEVIQMEPDCIQALYNLGLTQKKLGKLPEALDTFSNLAKILPNNIKILYQVGNMNKMVGNREEAIKWFEMVTTKAMHDAGVLEMLGSLYEESEDEPKALHYFTEAFQARPVNMNVVMWLGAYYVRKEHFEKAVNYFEIASKIEPKEAKWQLLIASCLRRTGAYSKALAKYKEILLIHPSNIECLRYLAHMCASLGKHEEARDYEAWLKKAERDIPSRPLLDRGRGDLAMKEKGRMEIMILPHGTTISASSALMPQWTLTTSTKRKRLQDEWEIGDDLLPM